MVIERQITTYRQMPRKNENGSVTFVRTPYCAMVRVDIDIDGLVSSIGGAAAGNVSGRSTACYGLVKAKRINGART